MENRIWVEKRILPWKGNHNLIHTFRAALLRVEHMLQSISVFSLSPEYERRSK